jgi:pimeloyl-ACP methyl ester carboxylesterase
VLEGWLGPSGTELQYTAGVPSDQLERLSPDNWTLDWVQLSRPGNRAAQIALFGDYRHNVELYPQFQAWMRRHRPPALIIWGRNDPFFTTAGAMGFQRDLPGAEIHLLDGSHFLLETHGPQATQLIRSFLRKILQPSGDQ